MHPPANFDPMAIVQLILGEPQSLAEARGRRQRPFVHAVVHEPDVAAMALLLARVYRGHVLRQPDPKLARLMAVLRARLVKRPKKTRQLDLLALIAEARAGADGLAVNALRTRAHLIDPEFRTGAMPPSATIRKWLADGDDDAWVAAKLIHHCGAFGYSRDTRVNVKRQRKVPAVERIYNVLREVRRKAQRVDLRQ